MMVWMDMDSLPVTPFLMRMMMITIGKHHRSNPLVSCAVRCNHGHAIRNGMGMGMGMGMIIRKQFIHREGLELRAIMSDDFNVFCTDTNVGKLKGRLVHQYPAECEGIGMVNSVDRVPLSCLVANGMEFNSMNSFIHGFHHNIASKTKIPSGHHHRLRPPQPTTTAVQHKRTSLSFFNTPFHSNSNSLANQTDLF
ncbi:hypothetical protein OSB04_002019 [Centaurea solstitialis]|uniref:Uncharacterized protein n=1 Tax=Centaurea solstitialis TaxID=347529 RepID=A0AA38TS26_9ASTR|nr:hypothetical protein OSB04_002019 [Centaurea solstitialis]